MKAEIGNEIGRDGDDYLVLTIIDPPFKTWTGKINFRVSGAAYPHTTGGKYGGLREDHEAMRDLLLYLINKINAE